ncbi:MAG: hypothetical protein KDN22_20490 [Verrucomicrobiae bacterium]|nr:hypothetical protein [Verrucomicrobiae bacterium]
MVASSEREVVREFFELFKTPWDFAQDEDYYPIVIATSEAKARACMASANPPELLILFSSMEPETGYLKSSLPAGTRLVPSEGGYHRIVDTDSPSRHFPIYGAICRFEPQIDGGNSLEKTLVRPLLKESVEGTKPDSARLIGVAIDIGDICRRRLQVARIGYDLFAEVKFLLQQGQPASNASVPTLEHHIDLLRSWITAAGFPVVEIPPVPDGHAFIGCLTHDMDHPLLRNHLLDHTMLGFVFRSIIQTPLDVIKRRLTLRAAWRNAKAVIRLPLVYLGIERDPWLAGVDQYRERELELGVGATFFVIPKRATPGEFVPAATAATAPPAMRSAKYALADVTPVLNGLSMAGAEIGVHGIDAWADSDLAREERMLVTAVLTDCAHTDSCCSPGELGIRMHWLYFDAERSPAILEQGGFTYDSTMGYCETVGFRAGTAQAWQPLGCREMLELPMILMDTALFYRGYLHLTEAEAASKVKSVIDQVERCGGAVTINWHDRSLAAERHWEHTHDLLIHELQARRAWLPTASTAVAWFRRRRAAILNVIADENGNLSIECSATSHAKIPGLRIRIHPPTAVSLRDSVKTPDSAQQPIDLPFASQVWHLPSPIAQPLEGCHV